MLSEALPRQSRAINSNQEQQTASKSKQEQASQMILSGKNKSRQNVGYSSGDLNFFLKVWIQIRIHSLYLCR